MGWIVSSATTIKVPTKARIFYNHKQGHRTTLRNGEIRPKSRKEDLKSQGGRFASEAALRIYNRDEMLKEKETREIKNPRSGITSKRTNSFLSQVKILKVGRFAARAFEVEKRDYWVEKKEMVSSR